MIDQYAFSESSLESIEFPSTLEVIEDSAFLGCKDLRCANFPEGIRKIELYAFFNCGLRSITLPHTLETISRDVLSQCKYLARVHLPDGLKIIGRRAFNESGIEEIELPASVEEIQRHAFAKNFALKKVIIKGNSSLRVIEEDAFGKCIQLKEI